MRLPNGDRATIRPDKLTDYVLNPDHPVGKHKARLFSSLLGITRHSSELLMDEIRLAASSIEAEVGRRDDFGNATRSISP